MCPAPENNGLGLKVSGYLGFRDRSLNNNYKYHLFGVPVCKYTIKEPKKPILKLKAARSYAT